MTDVAINRLINKRWQPGFPSGGFGTPVDVRYCRPGGAMANTGQSPAAAWPNSAGGLERALRYMAMASVDHPVRIDITGCTMTSAILLNLGGTMTGGIDEDIDLSATGPDNFAYRNNCQITAEPTHEQDLTITGAVANATSGLYTITVVELLVVNALKGMFLLGAGLGEWAVVQSNTAHDIVVTTTTDPSTFTTPAIYSPGATLTFGDPATFNSAAIYLIALCDWQFSGIAFKSTADALPSAIDIWAVAPVFFQMCTFDGVFLVGGVDSCFMDACYVTGHFGQDGGAWILRNSYFNGITPNLHGSGGKGDSATIQCWFDDLVGPWGGGNAESEYGWSAQNTQYDGAEGRAINMLFGAPYMTNCVISNSGGDAILVTHGAKAVLTNVDGAANGGVGINVQNGGQVRVDPGTTVTGATGDIRLGDAGIMAYADLPGIDLSQLVNVISVGA
jgi:hypothetical protein